MSTGETDPHARRDRELLVAQHAADVDESDEDGRDRLLVQVLELAYPTLEAQNS